jgi:hypothetical protein
MTAILTIAAAAFAAFVAHMVYGAILAGRDYNQSEQAWVKASDRLVPKRLPAQRPTRLAKAQLQRA